MTIERPMFPPVDRTRRRFLTVVGAVSVVGIPAATAEGINLGANKINVLAPKTPAKEITPSQGIEGDPIYAAIEAHRKANATMQAIFAEHRQAHELADAKVGPAHLDISSMVDPGKTVEASCWWDIERAIPCEQYPDLYAYHNRLLDERKAVDAR
jgi:hypothetical protein